MENNGLSNEGVTPYNKDIENELKNASSNPLLSYDKQIVANKELRKATDELIQKIKDLPSSRERSLAITKLQEGVMWLGMDLKRLGEANPYPNSKDSSNTIIDPTADNLKF